MASGLPTLQWLSPMLCDGSEKDPKAERPNDHKPYMTERIRGKMAKEGHQGGNDRRSDVSTYVIRTVVIRDRYREEHTAHENTHKHQRWKERGKLAGQEQNTD